MQEENRPIIHVAAVVLHDEQGRIATVRKKSSVRFQFPGGKPEAGETDLVAAVRECEEELGLTLDPAELHVLGIFTAPASNEVGFDCQETLFEYSTVIDNAQSLKAQAEIEEICWRTLSSNASDLAEEIAQDSANLAPLLRQILPVLPQRHSRPSFTFFTGSALGQSSIYAQAVSELSNACASWGITAVYGGGKVGLMGLLAETMLAAGGQVIGVIPQLLMDREVAYQGLTRLEVVADMDKRKSRLSELGDALIALPGGSGTLEEFFEAWTWQQLGIHHKPVALYNVAGYWNPLIEMIHSMVKAGFLSQTYLDSLIVADNPTDLVNAISSWTAPAIKWE